jgi:hypothetical protein
VAPSRVLRADVARGLPLVAEQPVDQR